MMYCVQTWLGDHGWCWTYPSIAATLEQALLVQQIYEYRGGFPARVISVLDAERKELAWLAKSIPTRS